MCGKFTQLASWQEVHAFSQPLVAKPGDEAIVSTPMRMAQIMRLNADGERELVPMRWGFAGKNDTTPSRPRHMHARTETIDQLPTFKHVFAKRRGILMVHTFNEGEEMTNGKTKQWVITPNDGLPIAIGVIWEQWQNGAETLDTFIPVTVPANALISRITDRMLAVLPRETWSTWLGETTADGAGVKAVLKTFEDAGNWDMAPQQSSKASHKGKPVKPAKPPQDTLF
jgi:putative SOS response-associated peptidase YedK